MLEPLDFFENILLSKASRTFSLPSKKNDTGFQEQFIFLVFFLDLLVSYFS